MLNKAEKEVMKVIDDKGCEFPNGAGVAGPEGEKRRCSLTKRLHDLFYDMSEENKTRTLSNRYALKEKLEKLAYDEQAFAKGKGKRVPGDDASVEKPKKKKPKRVNNTPKDTKLAAITTGMWDETTAIVII